MKNYPPIEFFAIIWGVFLILGALTLIFSGANITILAILAAAAFGATMAITVGDSGSAQSADVEKAKRTLSRPDDSSGLLALLDPEDIEELRPRVKRRLLDRIEGSGDGELSSLDALLAEQEKLKRRT